MPSRQLSTPGIRASFARPWLKWTVALLACLGILAVAGYVTRCSLLLNVARIVLNHDSALVAQERADAVAIVFAEPPPVWITPMKNQMNDIWEPIKANGVNYYMFAKPQTWFRTYSERSNPISPYYQAWVGGYVIKAKDGSLPTDLESLAWQVTQARKSHRLHSLLNRGRFARPPLSRPPYNPENEQNLVCLISTNSRATNGTAPV